MIGTTKAVATNLATILIVGLALLSTAPAPYHAIDDGLDWSYKWALNRAAVDGMLHGHDLGFNYGPFGYLLFPMDIGSNLVWGLVPQWSLFLLLGIALSRLWELQAPWWALCLFALSLQFAKGLGMDLEYVWLLTMALMLSQVILTRSGLLAFGAAGCLGGFLLLAKFSTGLIALCLIGVAMIALTEERSSRTIPAALTLLTGFATVLVSAVLLHFGSPVYLGRWLRLSYEITAGYSAALSLSGFSLELAMGISMLLCFGAIAAIWVRNKSAALPAVALFLMPTLLAFKHGFVRQATHAPIFFPVSLVCIAALVPMADGRRCRRAAAIVLGLAFLLTGASRLLRPLPELASFATRASGLSGMANIASLVRLPEIRRELAERGAANLHGDRLPALWVDTMRRDPGRVDVIPSNLALLPANDLPWGPDPILQTYNAYTPFLDQVGAQHFLGPRAPKYVLFELATIDLRHPLLDAPAITRALLRMYRVIAIDEAAGRLLLRREPASHTAEAEPGTVIREAKQFSGSGSRCRLFRGFCLPNSSSA